PGGTSQGSANISLTGVSVQNIPDIAASISTVGPLGVVLDIPSLKVLNLASIGALAAGNYIFSVTGTVSAVEASYSGNIQLSGASSVPVPAAVWLFGSALVGLMGVSGRKKKTLS
ncbi:MAG: hypothetical protein HOP02_17140, partial [Methylococcaceae bacterium]|nr:hypothetical protein [Methylococcaceae bacterium]